MSGVEGGSVYEQLKRKNIIGGLAEAAIILGSIVIIILVYTGVINDGYKLFLSILCIAIVVGLSEVNGYLNYKQKPWTNTQIPVA